MKKLVCVILTICVSVFCVASLQSFMCAYATSVPDVSSPEEPPAAMESIVPVYPAFDTEEESSEPAFTRKTNTLSDGANFYIVGNPDCFPYEYYDRQTGNYEGILPRILSEIAEANGISLLYFNSSNSRDSLAENSQGEIISACIDDEFPEFEHSEPIFTYVSEDGERHTVSIAYSNAAGSDLVELISKSLNSISNKTKLEYFYTFVEDKEADDDTGLIVAICILGVLALGAAACAVALYAKAKKKRGKALETDFVLTAAGLEQFFDTTIRDVTRTMYDVTFLSCRFPSENAGTDEQRRNFAKLIKNGMAPGDALGFLNTGFGLVSNSENTNIDELVKTTQQAMLDEGLQGMSVYCGTHRLTKSDRHFAEAIGKAESAAEHARSQDITLLKYSESNELKNDYTEKELSEALKKGEFKPVYQPVFDADSGKLMMLEVYSRWESQTYGYVKEQRFRESFRKNDLITDLDFHIFTQCCRRLKYRGQIGKNTPPVICNFSRRSLLSKDFLVRILEILKSSGCSASSFIFEIRVKDRKTDLRALADVTDKLHEIGIAVSLDTAGTGLINYEDFSLLNIDYLKIDDSILRYVGKNEAAVLILNSVTTLHEVGVKLICNNITDEQLLKKAVFIDTDYIEGDYCCAPLDTAGAEKMLDSNK